ncbi:DUF3099 domain-containing protein [Streptomyces sp. NPDC001380]|uniref:DUF3099 domain-containing protein n=1 Tax=Streptomyces sp. NPDC001380 TaxID=3364566 RepID=UPI003697257C
MGKSSGHGEAIRITGARTGLSEDVRGRQRRYIISMSIRTLCVILAVVLWNVERPLAWVALVGGALLPYVAVVIANAGRENAPGLPDSFVGAQPRPMLGAPEAAGEQDAEQPREPVTLVGEAEEVRRETRRGQD